MSECDVPQVGDIWTEQAILSRHAGDTVKEVSTFIITDITGILLGLDELSRPHQKAEITWILNPYGFRRRWILIDSFKKNDYKKIT